MARRARNLRSACLAIAGGATLLATLLPPTAAAVTRRDRAGDVIARGVTPAERRALDLIRVRAVGEAAGLVVTATFRGNVARRLGRGNLRRAAVGLVLRPKRGARASTTAAQAKPAVLITTGPTSRPRTIRRTRSRIVAVGRVGRQVTFFILGPGLRNVARVEVGTIVSPDRPRGSPGASALASQLFNLPVYADGMSFPPPQEVESCDRLRELIDIGEEIEDRDERVEEWVAEAKRVFARRNCPPRSDGGAGRACEFGFDNFGNPTFFLIQFGCNQSFQTASFAFNAPIQEVSPGIGSAPPPTCQVDAADNRRVRCVKDDSFAAGQGHSFQVRPVDPQSCPSFAFVPTVEGQAFPEKSCRQ
jgi:hypothetical protein